MSGPQTSRAAIRDDLLAAVGAVARGDERAVQVLGGIREDIQGHDPLDVYLTAVHLMTILVKQLCEVSGDSVDSVLGPLSSPPGPG